MGRTNGSDNGPTHKGCAMAISKEAYSGQLDFLLRLNHDSVTTRMHVGYGGVVESTFDQLLNEFPANPTKGSEAELLACVQKAKLAWFVRGVDLPFITTNIRQQATASIDTMLALAQQKLTEKF